jgi:hypothetical protein
VDTGVATVFVIKFFGFLLRVLIVFALFHGLVRGVLNTGLVFWSLVLDVVVFEGVHF